jgi:hypothetical protein
LAFIDLRKAFDSVDRHLLLKILKRRWEVPPWLFNTIRSFLSDTSGVVQGHRVKTNVGVPQGAVLSPTLFNLYINSMLEKLREKGITALAFADDVALVAKGERKMAEAIDIVKRWGQDHFTELNAAKSGVMSFRIDRRTPLTRSSFHGIPVVTEYKYLGIVFDDCGRLHDHVDIFKSKLNSITWLQGMKWAKKLTPQRQYITWQALSHSRQVYAMNLLLPRSKRLQREYQAFLYNATRSLHGIKSLVNKEKLLRAQLGMSTEAYFQILHDKCMAQLQGDTEKFIPLCRQTAKVNTRIKTFLTQEMTPTLKIYSGGALPFTVWLPGKKKMRGRQSQQMQQKVFKCSCGKPFVDSHVRDCPRARQLLAEHSDISADEILRVMSEDPDVLEDLEYSIQVNLRCQKICKGAKHLR